MPTNAERQAAFKARMREQGYVQVAEWVPADARGRCREIAKALRDGFECSADSIAIRWAFHQPTPSGISHGNDGVMRMASLMKFSDVKAKHATPATLRQSIEGVLTADDDACSDAIRKYMSPPGIMGSREYDHAMAVNTILEYDRKNGGFIASAMVASDMSPRMLWDQVVMVYRGAGFIIKNGRVIGIKEIEDRSNGSKDERDEREDGIE